MGKINFKTIKKGAKEKGPVVGIIGGVVTLIASNIFTFFGTQKYVRKIDEVEEQLGRETTPKEKIKYTWKYFVPTGVSIIGGTGAVATGSVFKTKHFKAKLAAGALQLAAKERELDDLQEIVENELDEKTRKKVEQKIEEKQIERMDEAQPMKYNPEVPMGDKVYCYDPLFNVKFIASQNDIENAANIINRDLTTGSYAPLQQFYHNLDIPRDEMPDIADEIGWKMGEMLTVYCNDAKIKDGIPRMVIRYNIEPRRGYQDIL